MESVKLLVFLEIFACRCTTVIFGTPKAASVLRLTRCWVLKKSIFFVTFYLPSKECSIISFSFTWIIDMCMTE